MMIKKYFVLLIVLVCVTSSVHAYQFSPVTQDFSSSGIDSIHHFQLMNESETDNIAIKITIVHRDMDTNGNEIRTNSKDSFFVYPNQFLVKPGNTQTIRVQWIGDSNLQIEKAYRIIVQRVPISSSSDSNMNLLISYEGTIYVLPANIQTSLSLNSVRKVQDAASGNFYLEIDLLNNGTTHNIITDPILTIASYSRTGKKLNSVTLTDEQLYGFIGENILAKKRRLFYIPWPEDLMDGELRASLTMEPTR